MGRQLEDNSQVCFPRGKAMLKCVMNLFLLRALIAGLGLIMAGRVTAQTFRTLHSFGGGTNGCYVVAGLVLSSNALYGTARFGGIFDRGEEGMLFKVNTDGTGFTILHSFAATSSGFPP